MRMEFIPTSVSVREETPKSGHLILLSDPCLSLLCLSLLSAASISFVSLTCVFFLLEPGPGNPGTATFHKLRLREGHCHQELASGFKVTGIQRPLEQGDTFLEVVK